MSEVQGCRVGGAASRGDASGGGATCSRGGPLSRREASLVGFFIIIVGFFVIKYFFFDFFQVCLLHLPLIPKYINNWYNSSLTCKKIKHFCLNAPSITRSNSIRRLTSIPSTIRSGFIHWNDPSITWKNKNKMRLTRQTPRITRSNLIERNVSSVTRSEISWG